jgi:hypothetical protein
LRLLWWVLQLARTDPVHSWLDSAWVEVYMVAVEKKCTAEVSVDVTGT